MKTTHVEINPRDLPKGPAIAVAAADAGTTSIERYRQAPQPGTALPSGSPLVAIVRSGRLWTADTLEVTDSSSDGRTFQITLDVRKYTGPISANVEREVLVEGELGTLTAGHYAVVVTRITLEFQDRHYPDRTANPSKSEDRVEFDVR
jgi:hypothetical protein